MAVFIGPLAGLRLCLLMRVYAVVHNNMLQKHSEIKSQGSFSPLLFLGAISWPGACVCKQVLSLHPVVFVVLWCINTPHCRTAPIIHRHNRCRDTQ